MAKPNNRSIVSDINQLMASDPFRLAQLINAGLCLDAINQTGPSGGAAQTTPSGPPFANYGACAPLDDPSLDSELNPTVYQCRYDRERARQYALQWGSSDAYKDATPGMVVGAGTDCANFASQVLAAGGFRPTEHWNYTRNSNGYNEASPQQAAGYQSNSWSCCTCSC